MMLNSKLAGLFSSHKAAAPKQLTNICDTSFFVHLPYYAPLLLLFSLSIPMWRSRYLLLLLSPFFVVSPHISCFSPHDGVDELEILTTTSSKKALVRKTLPHFKRMLLPDDPCVPCFTWNLDIFLCFLCMRPMNEKWQLLFCMSSAVHPSWQFAEYRRSLLWFSNGLSETTCLVSSAFRFRVPDTSFSYRNTWHVYFNRAKKMAWTWFANIWSYPQILSYGYILWLLVLILPQPLRPRSLV